MDKKSMIYTRNGDSGMTQLGNKQKISKHSPTIIACGEIDELNSFLGLAKTHVKQNKKFQLVVDGIHRIQKELMNVNAIVAHACTKQSITGDNVTQLEQEIDKMDTALPPLTNFVIPGVNKASAHLHIARAVCRRAERQIIVLTEKLAPSLLAYINRLGDWLFIAARFMENFE